MYVRLQESDAQKLAGLLIWESVMFSVYYDTDTSATEDVIIECDSPGRELFLSYQPALRPMHISTGILSRPSTKARKFRELASKFGNICPDHYSPRKAQADDRIRRR